jgi:hypothetical protein
MLGASAEERAVLSRMVPQMSTGTTGASARRRGHIYKAGHRLGLTIAERVLRYGRRRTVTIRVGIPEGRHRMAVPNTRWSAGMGP